MRIAICLVLALGEVAAAAPMRPLPAAPTRAKSTGPVFHVDAAKGDDKADGSAGRPWRTIAAALGHLKAGDTLYLHAGVYFEAVAVTTSGITLRSAPGELAVIDAGVRDFEETPKTAWEPVKGGAPGELQSVKTFPALDKTGDKGRGVWVLGNFLDTRIPLHGYRFATDLRSDNELWTLTKNTEPDTSIYVGPGVWFDWDSHKIHVRLAHTTLAGQDNYGGETDARKVPLVIGLDRSALAITGAKHVKIWDIELRGSAIRTVDISGCDDVELDGVTVYGGAPAMRVASTSAFKLLHSALRGDAAPWSSRASLKYRGISPYLFVAGSELPQSHDWELAYSDFTDGHDGIVLDNIKTVRFHHNRIDNFNDDGIYLTLPPRKSVPEDVRVYENVITRVYTTLAFSEPDDHAPNTVGSGAYVYRNVFDLTGTTYAWIPKAAGVVPGMLESRLCGDHGSPIWEPLLFYQNTVITAGAPWRDYYAAQLVMGTKGSRRRVFNNVFLQRDGVPGTSVPRPDDDIEADGNLLWSPKATATRRPPPKLGVHDVYADPKLDADARPAAGSAAIDAGVALPAEWPDSLRASDKGKPDIGALPAGAPAIRAGKL